MASINKDIKNKLYALVECLADNYGFDVEEAFEHIADGTDVNHIAGFLQKEEKPVKEKVSPLEQVRKNVALWTKKLEADKFKDDDAKEKHIAKLEKEKAKLEKLEPPPPPPKEEKPKKKAEPKEEKPKKEEEKEKRIKRMSPALSSQLKTILENDGIEINDKLKKEFVKYVDDLSDDAFKVSGLADHMRAFSKTKVALSVNKDLDEILGSSVDEPAHLSLKALQSITVVASVEPIGTFWDADKGRFVTGPDSEEDEDIEEITFDGKTYGVGEKSGRVYLEINDKDVFQGFIGVGKFQGMTR